MIYIYTYIYAYIFLWFYASCSILDGGFLEAAKYLRRPDTPMDISQALVDADVRLIDSIIGNFNNSTAQNPLAPAALFASQLSTQVSTFFSNLNRPGINTTIDSNTNNTSTPSLSELSSPLVTNTKNILGGLGQKISSLNVWGSSSASSSTGNKSQNSPFLGSLSSSFVPVGDSSTAFVIDDDDDDDYKDANKNKDTHSISIQRTDQQRAQVHAHLYTICITKFLI